MLVLLLAAVSSAAGQSAAPPNVRNFVGLWRINVESSDDKAVSPTLLLNIRIAGDELTVERRDLASGATETARFPMDGHSARTVRDGRPVDGSAALEGATLVITSTLANGSIVKEAYVVGRSTMMMDRSTTAAGKTTTTNEFFQRVPDNQMLHGGVEQR